MKNTNSGISLIETLIYISIFSIFVTAIVSFQSNMTASRLHNQIVFEVNDQGINAMKTITQTLRNANGVNNPIISNIASSLSLVTDVPATNPTIFSETGGVLYVTEGTGEAIALTNNKVIVSNLSFSNFSRPNTPNIIQISFTITSVSSDSGPGGSYSFTFNGSSTSRK